MTTLAQAYGEWADLVEINGNTVTKNDARDILRAHAPSLSHAEGSAWWDAYAILLGSLGVVDNPSPTYANGVRFQAINDGAAKVKLLFDALAVAINQMPESVTVNAALRLAELRDERDSVDDAITRVEEIIANEPDTTVGRLVSETLKACERELSEHKQRLRDEIRNIIGDPDA